MEDCIFCKIAAGEIPASKVYEDDVALAFMDIRPITRGHLLVIPKKHAQLVSELDEDTTARLFKVVRKLDIAIRKLEGVKDITILVSDGPAAQQEVPHVHIHLIPRYENDGLGLKFPEGYGKSANSGALSRLAMEIATILLDIG